MLSEEPPPVSAFSPVFVFAAVSAFVSVFIPAFVSVFVFARHALWRCEARLGGRPSVLGEMHVAVLRGGMERLGQNGRRLPISDIKVGSALCGPVPGFTIFRQLALASISAGALSRVSKLVVFLVVLGVIALVVARWPFVT